jgi:hypothetical protein
MNQQFMGLNTRSFIMSGLIAGVAMGLLSNIPLVACLNCLLFAWVWGGGIGAVYLYRRSEKQVQVTNTQGLVLGAAAGVVGAIIGGLAAAVFGGLTLGLRDMLASRIGDYASTMSSLLASTGFHILDVIRNIFIYGIVGAIGGVIATALIWKASSGSVPPYTPPPANPAA